MKETILACGKKIVDIEIQGLQALKDSLNAAFEESIRLMRHCSGQVVVTGMGKSGHIARKIAATLTSTGTRAIFLHPAEASHGDMGTIQDQDVVIALSNSGETKELSDIIAYCHRYHVPLIAITQKGDSALAQQATLVLLIPPAKEACPNDLAPTTSSTMMLALGDALAMTLLEQKGFSAQDFKKFHPGGKLGQQLLHVKDLMCATKDTPLVTKELKMSDVIVAMTTGRLGCVGVIDGNGLLVGILTDGDLRRALQTRESVLSLTAGELMTKNARTITPDALAADAVYQMKEASITSLFVLGEDFKPLGVVHIHDCLKNGIF